MTENMFYPVPGRSAERNRRIAIHEVAGHALVSRALGDTVHLVSIIRGNGYEGHCTRSGPVSSLTFEDNDEPALQPEQIIGICERLEALGTPELGTSRISTAENYIRGMNNIIALVAGEAAEIVLCPDLPPLGTQHDFDEAKAFAKITVIAKPAVAAMIEYAKAESRAIISENLDIAHALVEALIDAGELSGEQVDTIIADAIAARAVKAEKIRRKDWNARQRSADRFYSFLHRPPDLPSWGRTGCRSSIGRFSGHNEKFSGDARSWPNTNYLLILLG
jgi:hypothetical protein